MSLFPTELKVLRKVPRLSQGALDYLTDEYARRRISIDPKTDQVRADVIHPSSGWVDTDLPRDEWVSTEIIEQTTGFALAGPTGLPIVQEFATYAAAVKAKATARVTFNVDVETEEPQDEPPSGQILAGNARRPRDMTPT